MLYSPDPEIPDNLETPEIPDNPETSENPEKLDNPETPDNPAHVYPLQVLSDVVTVVLALELDLLHFLHAVSQSLGLILSV